ncbi:MAG: hypothetical protein ACFFG0_09755, partial [Candidatus Thorarchaeota archaeon]
MIVPKKLITSNYNYVWFIPDEVNIKDMEFPTDYESPSSLIFEYLISRDVESVKSVMAEIIEKFMEHEEIKMQVDRIKKNLIKQDKIVYLNDYSLILYSILETIELSTHFEKFLFIFYVEPMPNTVLFREFFSFIHGCLDFFQFKHKIFFKIILNENMRTPVLASGFPQLYDRLEDFEKFKDRNDIYTELEKNPFIMYLTSPNIYLWKVDGQWKKKIAEKFYDKLPLVKYIKNRIGSVINKNDKKGSIIYASYGIGKSTAILLALDYCNSHELRFCHPIYVYLHNTPKYNLAKHIIKEISIQILTKIKNLLPEAKFPEDIHNNENYISGIKSIFDLLDYKFILLIDEFDVLQTNSRLNDLEKSKIARFIYDLQQIQNISIILFSIDNAESFFRFEEFEQDFFTEYFETLEFSDVKSLIDYYSLRYKFDYTSDEIVREIIELSRGFPRLIMKILRLCWEKIGENINKIIDNEVIKEIQENYWGIRNLPETFPYLNQKIDMTDIKKKILEILLI